MGVLQCCLLAVGAVAAVGAEKFVPLPAPFTEHCIVGEKNEYHPEDAAKVPWFEINLDKPAGERWAEVGKAYASNIKELIGVIKNMAFPIFNGKLIQWVDANLGNWDDRLPEPHKSELQGLANATGVPLGEIVLYNAFYELNAVCTAIVAQDEQGRTFHARNLDFGLFMGWDVETHDWAITQKLRPTIINAKWTKGGKTLFKTVQFAGYTGVYNGVKQNAFTIAANERYDVKGGYLGLLNWIFGVNKNQWMTWAVRDVFEQESDYAGAVQALRTRPLMSPVYFTVGGPAKGDMTIIARNLESVQEQTFANETNPDGWYVLETNYDHAKAPLFLDDRRAPGNKCMQQLGRQGVGMQGIYNVLSSKTNYNKLTAYTVLMELQSGAHETYIRKCPDPCWPW